MIVETTVQSRFVYFSTTKWTTWKVNFKFFQIFQIFLLTNRAMQSLANELTETKSQLSDYKVANEVIFFIWIFLNVVCADIEQALEINVSELKRFFMTEHSTAQKRILQLENEMNQMSNKLKQTLDDNKGIENSVNSF